MTYYDLKTNEIWADSNIAGFHDEHIEIDEVIAPLIRELNIKGYKTKFCCSGHPFYSLCEAMVDSEETAKAFVGLIGTERTDNPRMPVRALYVTPDNDFYITFEENEQEAITLALPEGFEWDDEKTIRYNGIVGRIIVPMMLSDIAREAKLLICLSEYLYHNKNEYFDLLRSTQYSGGYIRWIKFFVNAVGEVAQKSAKLMTQYERIIALDEHRLTEIGKSTKSIFEIYNYLKDTPITTITVAERNLGFSFNTVSKLFHSLQGYGIVECHLPSYRNRVFRYSELENLICAD